MSYPNFHPLSHGNCFLLFNTDRSSSTEGLTLLSNVADWVSQLEQQHQLHTMFPQAQAYFPAHAMQVHDLAPTMQVFAPMGLMQAHVPVQPMQVHVPVQPMQVHVPAPTMQVFAPMGLMQAHVPVQPMQVAGPTQEQGAISFSPASKEHQTSVADTKPTSTSKKMKKQYNDEDKKIQRMAREEMNKLKVRRQVQNFVCLMHKKKDPKKPEYGSKIGYPWIEYHTLSQEWYKEDSKNDCLIPKIEGLHFCAQRDVQQDPSQGS
jgi:hypothetical protein